MTSFTPRACTLFLAVLLAVCIQLHQGQFVPGARCVCYKTIKYTPETILDFQVIERGPSCDSTQVIVTLEMEDKSKEAVCLNTAAKLAKAFLQCWSRINRDESQKTTCLNKRKKAEQK